jgi:hypothetical protein
MPGLQNQQPYHIFKPSAAVLLSCRHSTPSTRHQWCQWPPLAAIGPEGPLTFGACPRPGRAAADDAGDGHRDGAPGTPAGATGGVSVGRGRGGVVGSQALVSLVAMYGCPPPLFFKPRGCLSPQCGGLHFFYAPKWGLDKGRVIETKHKRISIWLNILFLNVKGH